MADGGRGRFGERDAPSFVRDDFIVPDVVKTFVSYFYRHIREKNIFEIHSMYETSFNKLSDRYFKQSPWPHWEAIAPLVDDDHVFLLLYKEMYYRHIYARLTPTLEQRCESWDNYCGLFQVFLTGNVNMQLPNQWLWDMIDEFVYQFQNFCQYRAKLKMKTEEEIAQLKDCDQVWSALGVMNYLQAFIDTSDVGYVLDRESGMFEKFTETDGYYDLKGGSNVLRTLGYFSIIGLTRVHCLLGDYHGAMEAVEPIDMSTKGVYACVVSCRISLFYYVGFCHMMLRNYLEATRCFNKTLVYISRNKQALSMSLQYEQLMKKNEQLAALLAICQSLFPQTKVIDDNVQAMLKEKFGEKMQRLAKGDEGVFDEMFSYACPKFILASVPAVEEGAQVANYNQEAYRLQLLMFLNEVKQLFLLQNLRSYLKLYKNITLGKLADYLEADVQKVRSLLLTMKFYQKANYGESSPVDELDFYIEGNMVTIIEQKRPKRFANFFINHISRCNDAVAKLNKVKQQSAP